MYRRSLWIALTLIVALWACGCGSKDAPMSGQTSPDKQDQAIGEAPHPTGQVAFHVTYVRHSRRLAKPAAVDSMTAYVYEPAGQKIAEQSLDHIGSRWKALITVPAGDDRRVDLAAYDGDAVTWLGADVDVDVTAGQTTTADVAMKEFVSDIAGLDSLDTDGSYTVTWSGVEDATEYTLEESTDETFSSPTSYTVSDTVRAITHAEDGTYWYRVKATSKYGDGKWCTAQSIVVAILGVPVLVTIPSPDDDGTYTVAWSAASHAEEYVVEEDDNAAFSSATEVYRGNELSVERTGMAEGSYWYRVKARNSYGESGWSNVVSVEVVIAEGTIEIDIPEPPNEGAPEGMAFIPAGSLQMGDAFDEGESDERPVHTVYMDAFYMDVYEVTNAQYRAYDPSHDSGSSGGHSLNTEDQPVVLVSWWDAIELCNWRSRQEGLEECYDESTGDCDFSKNGYHLPTEAEWEYAARGGLEGKRYPWGDEAPVCQGRMRNGARFDDNGVCHRIGTAPVGSYSPNGYGLYDMAGNVWEWCNDWWDGGYYSDSPENNPTGPTTGTLRVLRGGSCYYGPSNLRCASRNDYAPALRVVTFGFRCVRGVQSLTPSRVNGETTTFILPGGATIEMVWIAPGTFTMGSPSLEPGRDSDEGPQHEVTITKGSWLGKYELTQEQWQSVMGTTPWAGEIFVQEKPNHPAVYLWWGDIQAFIVKLNEAEGDSIYRLPTEAEWEYACRAGTTTPWSFGDDENESKNYAWYYYNAENVGEKYAHAVGTKLPNPWGLYDMHGNVREWVQDWYGEDYYSKSPKNDPTGPETGTHRITRGGSWDKADGLYDIRCADRWKFRSLALYSFGFRLVRTSE